MLIICYGYAIPDLYMGRGERERERDRGWMATHRGLIGPKQKSGSWHFVKRELRKLMVVYGPAYRWRGGRKEKGGKIKEK